MLCPYCYSGSCRRSRRRGLEDYLATLVRLRPWRCRDCEKRFYAWSVPVSLVQFVHCPQCGNFDLERIGTDHVHTGASWLGRLLGLPGYRCDPCRFRFFSLRPFRPIQPRAAPPERTSQPTPEQDG